MSNIQRLSLIKIHKNILCRSKNATNSKVTLAYKRFLLKVRRKQHYCFVEGVAKTAESLFPNGNYRDAPIKAINRRVCVPGSAERTVTPSRAIVSFF